jgi:hypothetical protein
VQVPELSVLEHWAAGNVKALLTQTEHFPAYCHPPLSKQEKLVVAVPELECKPVLQVQEPEFKLGWEQDAMVKEGALFTQEVQNP